MLQLGLIGNPLSHSWSADYFARRHPDCCYRLFALSSLDNLRTLIERNHLDGFNVTLPYKRRILPLLDSIDSEANTIGAVNCVKVDVDCGGRLLLKGYNTDAPAFAQTLRPLMQPHYRNALVLGTGGAAHAVEHVLRQYGLTVTYVSRTPLEGISIGYPQMPQALQHNEVVVNATPTGMWPNQEDTPINTPTLLGGHLVYDLIYNPSVTTLLRQAQANGAVTQNGAAMLALQAELSYALWTEGGGR